MSINVTEGTGKTVAAESISSSEYQLVKLVDATASSVTRTGVAANPLQVSLANHGANSTAVKVDGSAVTQPVSGTVGVSGTVTVAAAGDVANDGVDSGNPIKTGGVARTTNPTAVADADRVNRMHDKVGRTVTATEQVRQLVSDQTTTISASTSETTVGTAVASTFLDLVMVTVANTSGTGVRVDFRDTTAGSIRFSLYCPATATTGFIPKIPLTQATVNTNWTAQSSGSVTDLRIFVQFIRNI